LVAGTSSDGRRHLHRRLVKRTDDDEAHHRRFQRPLRPPTLEPAGDVSSAPVHNELAVKARLQRLNL
jgi:hypothetical protein